MLGNDGASSRDAFNETKVAVKTSRILKTVAKDLVVGGIK